jgi:hypothetical protein
MDDPLGLPTILHPDGIAPGQFPSSPLLQGGTVPISSAPQRPVPGAKPAAVSAPKPAASSPASLDETLTTAADEEAKAALADMRTQRGVLSEQAPKDREATDEYSQWMKDNPPPQPFSFHEEAPHYADFAKQTSPLLMILTAIGGKAMGVSGMGMLGAMTGMVEGTAAGNKERYDAAYQEYQDHYKRQREEYANLTEYYDQMMKYKKGQFGAEQEVSRNALEMIGADEKNLTSALNVKKALDKTQADLQKRSMELERLRFQSDAKYSKAGDDAIRGAQSASSNIPKLSEALDDIQKAYNLLPSLEAQFTRENGNSPVYAPEAWNKWLTSQTGSSEQQQFVQYMRLAKPLLATLETGGPGQRSNMMIQKLVSDSATLDVFSRTPDEIRTSISQLLPLVRQQRQQQEMYYKLWQTQGQHVGVNIPELPKFESPKPIGEQRKDQTKSFATEEEAVASGVKGEVMIAGRRARID